MEIIKSKLKFGLLLSLPFNMQKLFLGQDSVTGDTPTEKKTDFSVVIDESKWDRVRKMFQRDEFGSLSMELHSILQAICMSTFVGGMYGGVTHSRNAYMDFMRKNQHTIYKNHLDAKRQLQDAVTRSFAKGALRWGWRICVFTTTFTAVSTVLGTYRGRTSVLDYVAAGSASGFIYKLKHGPQACLVGTGLGMVLGAVAGTLTLGILQMSGMSMEEARYWQHHWYDQRSDAIKKNIGDFMEQDNEYFKIHNREIGEAGKDIANLGKIEDEESEFDQVD